METWPPRLQPEAPALRRPHRGCPNFPASEPEFPWDPPGPGTLCPPSLAPRATRTTAVRAHLLVGNINLL